jgi:hypothetical protein
MTTIRMDRSKYFATVHGERAPDDKLAGVAYQQDGLFYDSHDMLIESLAETEDQKKKMEALRRAASKSSDAPARDAAAPAKEDDGEAPITADEVNLASWLRGEARYPWFSVAGAIKSRYAKQVKSSADAVDFLVNDQKIVGRRDLAPHLADMLPSDED